jgi:fructuronate reductase
MRQRLNHDTLQTLRHPASEPLGRPSCARTGLIPGVVHLGLVAFDRAHQAVVFDALLQPGRCQRHSEGFSRHASDLGA